MLLVPRVASGIAWVVFFASWLLAAIWSSRAQSRAGLAREFPNRAVTVAGALLIFRYMGEREPFLPVSWDVSDTIGWSLFAFVLAGMAFAWWARLHLGTLWSGTVTRKSDHRIVDTGPYALVRHPIYTGILFSLLATALQRGALEPLIGVLLMFIGFWMKARLEEEFLREGLGAEAYDQYRARVPMLIPFTKRAA